MRDGYNLESSLKAVQDRVDTYKEWHVSSVEKVDDTIVVTQKVPEPVKGANKSKPWEVK